MGETALRGTVPMRRRRTVSALNLRLGDTVVLEHGQHGRVVGHHIQGSHPVVVVHYYGIPGCSASYPLSAQLQIDDVD